LHNVRYKCAVNTSVAYVVPRLVSSQLRSNYRSAPSITTFCYDLADDRRCVGIYVSSAKYDRMIASSAVHRRKDDVDVFTINIRLINCATTKLRLLHQSCESQSHFKKDLLRLDHVDSDYNGSAE